MLMMMALVISIPFFFLAKQRMKKKAKTVDLTEIVRQPARASFQIRVQIYSSEKIQ